MGNATLEQDQLEEIGEAGSILMASASNDFDLQLGDPREWTNKRGPASPAARHKLAEALHAARNYMRGESVPAQEKSGARLMLRIAHEQTKAIFRQMEYAHYTYFHSHQAVCKARRAS